MAGMPHRRPASKAAAKPVNPAEAAHEPEPAHEPERAPSVGLPLPGLALPVRPSLRVGAVNDPAELEAESVAELVVDTLRRAPDAEPSHSEPSHSETCCSDGGHAGAAQAVRRAAVVGAEGGEVDGSAAASIEQLRGGGQPLPEGIRRNMESAFDADLAGVRVHTGPTAARLNDQLGAHAFTTGNDIVFADGVPDVSRPDGQRLMAHELTHVLQHRGADTLSALRRQAATVAGRNTPAPEPIQVESGELSLVARPAGEAESAGPGAAPVRRVFDVAVNPNAATDGTFYIESIVIKNRPKNPDTGGMAQEGGKSFHHESAWTLIERRVTQFSGKSLSWTVEYLTKYGLDGWTAMPKPGADGMSQIIALNAYFKAFLIAQAQLAAGWLGSSTGHSKQGGTVAKALEALQKNWSEATMAKVLSSTFEPSPSMVPVLKHWAAEAHADNFYSAFQVLLEDESGASKFSTVQHEQVLEWIKDWTTEYWSPDVDESMMEDSNM